MMENVKNTTTTMGTIADSRTNYSGQANTRMYDENEKAKVLRDRKETNNVASSWSSNQLNNVLSVGNPTPQSKIPGGED